MSSTNGNSNEQVRMQFPVNAAVYIQGQVQQAFQGLLQIYLHTF